MALIQGAAGTCRVEIQIFVVDVPLIINIVLYKKQIS